MAGILKKMIRSLKPIMKTPRKPYSRGISVSVLSDEAVVRLFSCLFLQRLYYVRLLPGVFVQK
jgi:hypothetical protein